MTVSGTPDVRARMSAEGVDEIVRALQKVLDQSKRTGKDGSAALGMLSSASRELAGLLPALSFGAVVAGAVALTKNALDTADALGKLSQKTGQSVEQLSVLKFAAEKADRNFEEISKSLTKFTIKLDGAGANVKDLFGSMTALNGLNQDQRFLKVAEAIAKIEDPVKKAAMAAKFFGEKAGAELIPLFNDLANGGFKKAREEAERLGIVFDTDMADSAQRTNDNFKTLKARVEGAAVAFSGPLAQALADATDDLNNMSLGGDGVFKTLGKLVVGFVTSLIAGFDDGSQAAVIFWDAFTDTANTSVQAVKTNVLGLFSVLDRLNHLDFSGAMAAAKATSGATGDQAMNWASRNNARRAQLAGLGQDFASRVTNSMTDQPGSQKPNGPPPPGGNITDPDAAKKAADAAKATAKAMLAAQQAALDDQLKKTQEFNKLSEEQAKAAYEHGYSNLEQYYNRRRDIITSENVEEIETLKKKHDLIAAEETHSSAEHIKQQQDLAKIDAEIDAKRDEGKAKLLANETERAAKEKELAKARHDAKLQELASESSNARAQLDLATGAIDNKVAAGEMFPAQAIEAKRAAVIALIPAMRAAAEATLAVVQADLAAAQAKLALNQGTEVEIAQQAALVASLQGQVIATQQSIQGIDSLAISVNQSAQSMETLKAGVQDALQSGLTTFFTEATDGAHSIGDAFRDLASTVIQSLMKMVTQMLINLAIQKLLGAFGGGGGAGIVGAIAGGSSGSVAVADGGHIRGPGTRTSDSIPARLSDFEFVEPAHAVEHYGPEVFEAMRQKRIPREWFSNFRNMRVRTPSHMQFAEGGLVMPVGGAGGAGAAGAAGTVRLQVDRGLIAEVVDEHMSGPRGGKIMIEHMTDKRKAFKSTLG